MKQVMEKKIKNIGLDVHKNSISIGIADDGRDDEVRLYGEIDNDMNHPNTHWERNCLNLPGFITVDLAFLQRTFIVWPEHGNLTLINIETLNISNWGFVFLTIGGTYEQEITWFPHCRLKRRTNNGHPAR